MNFWKDRPVLVTGATGLLGSWLTKQLVDNGASVVTIVRDIDPHANFFRLGLQGHVTQVRGDITDFSLVERTLHEYFIDTVFNLAAQTQVRTGNRGPLSTWESNVRGTWTVMEATRHVNTIRSVIQASSDKAYGSQVELPYTEEAPLLGRHPYDASKACADIIAQTYANTFCMPIYITRCGNLFGGGDLNWDRIVPEVCKAIIDDRPIVLRSDGTFIRDYFFVKDAVDAYLCLSENVQDERRGEAWNFSFDKPLTVLEMVEAIKKVAFAPDHPVQIGDGATGEIKDQYLSSQKAREQLGWNPRHTLEEGLAETFAWYRDFLT